MFPTRDFHFRFLLLVVVSMHVAGVSARAETVPPPEKVYSIQLGAFPSASAAAECKNEFEQMGLWPIVIGFESPYYKVQFGTFYYYSDALIYKKWLRSSGKCADAFLRSRAYEGPQDLGRVNVAPLTPVFTLQADSITSCPDPRIAEDQPPVAPINALLASKDLDAATTRLAQLIHDAPTTDAIAGWARYQLGKIKREKRMPDAAMVLFKEVADGTVACRRVERIYAMRQVAAIEHVDKQDRLKALQAYDEIGKFCADDDNRAWCKLERAGLIFELVRSEAGTWNEARRACQEVVADVPETMRAYRATAELMYIETYFWEGNHERVIELTPAFLEKYPDVKREYVSALCMTGISCDELKRPEEAISWLLKIFQTDFTDEEGYRGVDLLQRSAFRLAAIFAELGDTANRDLWLNWLKRNHPDSKITRAAVDLLEGNHQ